VICRIDCVLYDVAVGYISAPPTVTVLWAEADEVVPIPSSLIPSSPVVVQAATGRAAVAINKL
jgi:hypothetical protein